MQSLKTGSAIPLGICLCKYTGLRIGELCALKYGDFAKPGYLVLRRMQIKNGKNGDYEVVEHLKKKKTGAKRVLPLLPEQATKIFQEIQKYAGHTTPEMTMKYLRDTLPDDESDSIMIKQFE